MKFLYFLLFFASFCLTGLFSEGQAYQPFVVEQAHWEMTVEGCVGDCYGDGPITVVTGMLRFKLEGDSIVNGIVYKKYYESDDIQSTTNSKSSGGSSPWELQALFREDTANRKVYYIGYLGFSSCSESSTDTLLFDFSKNVNDTILFNFPQAIFANCYNQSASIDSISYITYNTYYRRIFNFSPINFVNGFALIEGIGPSFGLFGSPGVMGEGSYISSLTNYCIGSDAQCWDGFVSAINEVKNTDPISIHPNPAVDKFQITGIANGNSTMEIFNLEGKKMLTKVIENNSVVDVSGLPNSIYLLNVIQPAGYYRTKICVCH